jgi:prophage regulatory protein
MHLEETTRRQMKVIRQKAVVEMTGLSRTTLWRLERQGNFPKRRRLGPNSVGWHEVEVLAWLESRPTGINRLPRK